LTLGWQFALGEFVGGPLMIVLLALAFRVFLKSVCGAKTRSACKFGVSGAQAELLVPPVRRSPTGLCRRQGFTP
jgi:hypothetical protein